jgi:two-component system, NarL family, nitrate/nitrite response regulator NarL
MNRTDWTPTAATSGAAAAAAVADIRRPKPDPEEKAVLVCESQPITAEGVRALLEDTPPFKYAAGCSSLAECRDLLRRARPQVVILDKALGMQAVLDWLADTRLAAGIDPTMQAEGPAAGVNAVVWSVSMTEAEALRFLQAGAKGVIRKTAPPELLLDCLKNVASGLNWMEPGVFGDSARFERSSRSALTAREQQVMELVEQGLKNREIARELGIRPGTVKIHLKHIFEKTGVRGRYGLALSGMRQKGILALDEAEDGD